MTGVNDLYSLPGKDEVLYIAMGMWTPYRDAVQAVLPDARIVIDKFHVVKMANEAVETVRKPPPGIAHTEAAPGPHARSVRAPEARARAGRPASSPPGRLDE